MTDEIHFGRFCLDLAQGGLLRDGKLVPLGNRALEILIVLASAKGKIVTKSELMTQVWPGRVVEENNIQVHVSALRKVLGDDNSSASWVVTIPGRGYRLVGTQSPARRDRTAAPRPEHRMRYLFEDYALDTNRRELCRRNEVVPLEPQAFDLLEYLIQNRGRVVSRDDLIASVWAGRIVSDSAVTTRINAARCAIDDNGKAQRLVKTVPRKGIRFVGPVQEEAAGGAEAGARSSTPFLVLPDKPSIAVLPFTDMSGEPGQAYFSDGITEDIVTELSRFSELFVIAHNSSHRFKGSSPDIRQVARELGVRYVLVGSIRRAADRVRISAQLIEAVSGAQLWGERYDRELTDVFAVQ